MKEQRLYYHTVALCDQLAKYCKQKEYPVPFQPLVIIYLALPGFLAGMPQQREPITAVP